MRSGLRAGSRRGFNNNTRVEPGGVRRFSKFHETGRVGSGAEGFKSRGSGRVGSGRVGSGRPDSIRPLKCPECNLRVDTIFAKCMILRPCVFAQAKRLTRATIEVALCV